MKVLTAVATLAVVGAIAYYLWNKTKAEVKAKTTPKGSGADKGHVFAGITNGKQQPPVMTDKTRPGTPADKVISTVKKTKDAVDLITGVKNDVTKLVGDIKTLFVPSSPGMGGKKVMG